MNNDMGFEQKKLDFLKFLLAERLDRDRRDAEFGINFTTPTTGYFLDELYLRIPGRHCYTELDFLTIAKEYPLLKIELITIQQPPQYLNNGATTTRVTAPMVRCSATFDIDQLKRDVNRLETVAILKKDTRINSLTLVPNPSDLEKSWVFINGDIETAFIVSFSIKCWDFLLRLAQAPNQRLSSVGESKTHKHSLNEDKRSRLYTETKFGPQEIVGYHEKEYFPEIELKLMQLPVFRALRLQQGI